MVWRKVLLGQHGAQSHALGRDIAFAHQGGVHLIQQAKLLRRRRRWMVGDIVGEAHKAIKSQYGFAMLRGNQEGRHREILIPVTLAGLERVTAHVFSLSSFSLAWARPFHMPPLPDQYWMAESSVKAA